LADLNVLVRENIDSSPLGSFPPGNGDRKRELNNFCC